MIRSPVFDRMLKSGMKETHDRTVEIEDANMETVTTMVYYMYTGKVRMFCDRRRLLEHWETNIKYEELLVLANKYDVLELVNHCGAEVAKALTKEKDSREETTKDNGLSELQRTCRVPTCNA